MKQRRRALGRFSETISQYSDSVPGVPLVEIAGERRVLIENHAGILEYGDCQVVVRVSFGAYFIRGCGLTVVQMSKDQLIICGRIDAVALERRC